MDDISLEKAYRRSKISYIFSSFLWILLTVWFGYGLFDTMRQCSTGDCGNKDGAGLMFAILFIWVPYSIYIIIYTLIFLNKRKKYLS
jgi:ABC-type antimicrobial peptide transport system permease subunit